MAAPIRLEGRNAWYAGLALAAFGAALYLPTLRNGYVFDDEVVVKLNPAVAGHRYWDALTAPYWPEIEGVYAGSSNWRPLATLSWTAERHAIRATNPILHHAGNALLHGLLVAALFPFARRLAGGAWAIAACALFAAHPSHAESVAPVVGRCDLLAAIGVLAALECFLRFRDGGPGAGRWLALGAIAYAAGLGGKESAAPLLVLLPAADWLLRGRPLRALFGRQALAYLPFLLVASLYLGARIAVLGEASFVHAHASDASAIERLVSAGRNAVVSLELLLLPLRFHHSITTLPDCAAFTYPDPTGAAAAAFAIAGVVGGLGWLALVRRAPRAALLWLAMLLPWLPTSGVLPAAAGVSMRFLLLPSAFAACAAALLLKAACGARPRAGAIAGGAVAVLAAAGAAVSVARAVQWRDNGTYFAAVAAERSDCYAAHLSLGTWHAGLKPPQIETALDCYERALALNPDLPRAADVLWTCGQLADAAGQPDRAARHFRTFAERFADDPRAEVARRRAP